MRSHGANPRHPDGVDEGFAEYRRTRDRKLRDELVERNVPLAEFLARRFRNRGEPLDDLRQVALVGLLKSVERFEPDRDIKFASFATPTIVGELKRHFRDRGWAVRVPRRVQELHLALDSTIATLTQELGRPPVTAEVAARAGVRDEDVLEAMEATRLYRLPSLDAADPDTDPSTDARVAGVDEEFDAVHDRVGIAQMLSSLPSRERRIVYMRFFRGLTQSEIAQSEGISQMHVSRLLTRSLEALGRNTALASGL
jgi:RNA polymerase sigma-B factor